MLLVEWVLLMLIHIIHECPHWVPMSPHRLSVSDLADLNITSWDLLSPQALKAPIENQTWQRLWEWTFDLPIALHTDSSAEDTNPDPKPVYSAVDSSCSYIAQIACDWALAQRLAATKQKFYLDFEFTKRLQEQGGNATDACNADR